MSVLNDAGTAFDGDPSGDPKVFRRCLGQFATGVTVITANIGDEPIGMTVNSFSALSLDPPLILWSVNKASNRGQKFCTAARFAVNILAGDQIEISQLFGDSRVEQFEKVSWSHGQNGAPVLHGVAALFECDLSALHPGGDHLILVGRVTRAVTFERNTLIFTQGHYGLAIEHPTVKTLSA